MRMLGQIVQQHLNQRIFIGKPQAAPTESLGRRSAETAHKISRFNAFIARIGAHFGMHGRRFIFAQFTDVAHYKHARGGQAGQHIERGFHAVGVGIIRIIQHNSIFYTTFDLQTAFDVGKALQAV